jgi:hypothetical protein
MALEEWLQMSGPIVTQSHVAATVRARVGQAIDARRERIRVAMSTTGPNEDTGVTPNPSASGVVPAGTGGTASGQTSGTGSKSLRRPPMAMSPLSQPLFAPPPPPPPTTGAQAPAGGSDPGDELASTLLFPMEDVARAAQAAGGPPAPLGTFPVAAPAPPAVAAPAAQPSPSYFLAAAIGVVVAFAIGAGAFLLWHLTRPSEAVLPTGSSTPAVSVIVVPGAPPGITGAFPPAHGPQETSSGVAAGSAVPPTPTPTPTSSAVAVDVAPAPPATGSAAPEPAPPGDGPKPTAAATADGPRPSAAGADTAKSTAAPVPAAPSTGDQPAPAEPVVLEIPDGAIVLVGGAPLADGAHVVPRPKAGKTVTAVVRAAGYDDGVVVIDATTPSPVEVTLHKHRHRAAPAIPANPY